MMSIIPVELPMGKWSGSSIWWFYQKYPVSLLMKSMPPRHVSGENSLPGRHMPCPGK